MADDKPVDGMTAGQKRLYKQHFGPSGLSTFLTDLQTNRAPLFDAIQNQRLGSYLVGEGEKLWDAIPKPWNNPDTTLAVLDTLALPAEAVVGMGKGIGSIIKEAVTDPTPETAAEAALLVAGLGGGLSALGVGAKQARSLSMFVGRNAENADLSKLATAEKMEAKGHSREEIHDQTGWFRWYRPIVGPDGKRVIGPDGKPVTEPISDWRFEICDADSCGYVNPEVLTPTGRLKGYAQDVGVFPLEKIFEHPKLAKAYTGRPPSAVPVPAPAPASGVASSGAAIAAIMKKRLELRAELKALKGSGLDVKEYEAAYQKLEARDKELLDEYIVEYNKDKASASVKETELGPVETPLGPLAGSATSPPEWTENIFDTAQGMYGTGIDTSKLKSPILEIKGTKKEKGWGGASYSPSSDRINFGTLPGNVPSKTWIPWNEKGEYTQKLRPDVLEKNRKAAEKVFKKAGVALDTAHGTPDRPTVHSLRHWKTDRELSKEEQARLFETTPEAEEAWRLVHKRENTWYEKDRQSLPVFRGSALHELQHAIQAREGWQGGASWKNFGKGGPPRYQKKLKDPFTGERLTNKEKYYRILGEIEARLADSRGDLTDAQRLERRPWTREGGLDRLESQAILEKDFKAAGGPVYGSNIQHMADGGPPKLVLGGRGQAGWLEDKILEAQEKRQEYRDEGNLDSVYATVGGTEGVTGYFNEPLRLNPQDLVGIKGAMREERTIPGEKLRRLKKSISEKGYLDTGHTVQIVVREDGVPFVHEGNNRLAEAIESGRPSIKVGLQYLRGAEDVDGRMSPDKLSSMLVEAPEATAKDPSNLPALIAKTAALSLPDEPPPKGQTGKGQLFRGVGALMRRRIFPLIQAAQLGYEHLLSPEQKAEVQDFLASPAHEFVGMDKPGIEYFKDLFGMSEDSTEPRPDPIILSTFTELERQAAKLGEELAPFSSAFTDLKGQTYLLPRNITDNLGIDRAIYEAHEKAVPAARILQETDLGAYEQIVEAVERGDVEAVKPGTIDYYNRIKDTPGLNRASIEEEVVVRELALQEINLSTGQGVGSLAEEARDMTSGPLPMDQASRMARAEEMGSTDQGFNIDAYHGTSEPQSEVGADFDVHGDDYIRKFGGSGAKYGSFVNDIGDWFSESPDVADYFAGEMTDFQGMSAFRSRGVPQVYPVKLRLQNPARFDTYEDLEEAFRDWQDQAGPDEDATGTEFANWLKSAGKDGILIENSTTDTGELRKDYVVFDSENVRSRFWKPGDKDFARGGFVDKPLYDNNAIVGL